MDVPAVSGLRNQGNTCFMNAVIQCLSNTESFSEYMVGDFFKIDRRKHMKINSRSRAGKGEVTEQLANLLKCLWSRRSNSDAAQRFKQSVCRYGPQFGDSAQHDAQEFLLWLLDVMHEDLNLACRKHNRNSIPVPGGKVLTLHSSNSSLADHLRYNNSFVYDLFQSQVRSSLSCSCGRQSSTVDPLLCLSIPIPSCALSTILVRVSSFRRPHKEEISVSVEMRATVRELRDRISRQLRIPEKRLVLMTVEYESGVTELTDDSLLVQDTLCDDPVIHAVETSPPNTTQTDVLNVVVVNRDSETRQVFGPFFQCCISRSSSFRKIQLELLQSLTSYLNHTLDVARLSPEDFGVIVVVDGEQNYQLSPEVDHPLYVANVDRAISLCEDSRYRGPVHLNLILDWGHKVFSGAALTPYSSGQADSDQKSGVSIYDCLDLYFREERLQDEMSICPSCQKRTAKLKLTLFTLPDLLTLHLKRFEHSNTRLSKLSTPVSYPLTGLDMSPFMDDQNEGQNGTSAISRCGSRLSTTRVRSRSVGRDSSSLPSRWAQPWKRPDLRCHQCDYDSRCSTYDLVAVCNHSGNLLSGHYTAICRNPANFQWYNFDDASVTPVKESKVVCANAYLLFYQRSGLSPTNSCDSAYLSSASHDSRKQQDRPNRWSSFKDPVSASQALLSAGRTGSRYSRSREDVRGSFAYATIPPAKSRDRSIYRLLFRKKDREVPITRDREVTKAEFRVPAEARTSGLTVILPPEELPGDQKSNNKHHESEQKETKDDRLVWTVTSV